MNKKETNRVSSNSLERIEYLSWSDVQAIARRVIHAANLAVMVHGELDVFTEDQKDSELTD